MSTSHSTTSKKVLDKASGHFGSGNFPENLPIEQAFVHIGMYLGWVIEKGLYSEFFEDEGELNIYRFKNREISCTILSELWNGSITDEMLSKEGILFSHYYYGGGLYQADFKALLVVGLPSIYHVTDNWDNYKKIADRMDVRLNDWRKMVA